MVDIKIKLVLRNIWRSILVFVPSALDDLIRKNYVSYRQDNIVKSGLHFLVSVLRYKQPSSSKYFVAPADNQNLLLRNVNSYIVRAIYWYGEYGYEGNEVREWEAACRNAKSILEIGANIGYYTIKGSRASQDSIYTAIEAHPRTSEILKENVEANKLENVDIVSAAVITGDEQAFRMSIPTEDQDEVPAGAFLKTEKSELDRESNQAVEVRCVNIQTLLNEQELIKMDVEGMEYELLSAIEQYVKIAKPCIFIELLGSSIHLRKLLDSWRKQYGYRIYVSSSLGRQEIPEKLEDLSDIVSLYGTRDIIISVDSF